MCSGKREHFRSICTWFGASLLPYSLTSPENQHLFAAAAWSGSIFPASSWVQLYQTVIKSRAKKDWIIMNKKSQATKSIGEKLAYSEYAL